jgi:predicted RNA-binding protein Jag
VLTKLTLTIEQTVIENAKKYAQHKNKSISRMVEEYLRHVTESSSDIKNQNTPPTTRKIAGMFAKEYQDQPYQELLEAAILEKNL